MAQRPPRMPRRNTPESTPGQPHDTVEPQAQVPETNQQAQDQYLAEPATDALRVIDINTTDRAQPTARRASGAPSMPQATRVQGAKPVAQPASKPAASAVVNPVKNQASKLASKFAAKPTSTQPKAPLRERAKEKQSERRRDDRVKFSVAVRRKPGQKTPDTSPESGEAPVAAHRFSGRVAALLVVLAFFAVMLVPTVNYYRTQMAEINELKATIAAMETERDDLKAEIARWDDPLYIKQQARERINLVMPGEKLYKVIGKQPATEDSTPTNGSTYEVRQDLPWVDALIDSVRRSATD